MVSYIKKVKFSGSVVGIGFSNKYLLVVDNLYNLYILDKDNLNVLKVMNLYKNTEPMHKYSKAMQVSKDGDIALSLIKSNKVAMLKMDKAVGKKGVLNSHKLEVEVCSFSPDLELFATGGADGVTIVYELHTLNPITSLFPRSDYIASISFSKNSKLLASSSFDKNTVVFDISRNIVLAEFNTKEVVEATLFVEDDSKLFFVCRDGLSGVITIENGELISNKNFESWPTAIETTVDRRFAIVGTKSEYLYIVRVSDNRAIVSMKLEDIGVTNLQLLEGKLYIGYSSSLVSVIDCTIYREELSDALKKDKFADAKKIIDRNLFLNTDNEYIEKFDKAWLGVLDKIIYLLSKNQLNEAIDIAKPFIDEPKRNEEFSFYLAQRAEYATFLEAVDAKEFKVAYEVARRNPPMQELNAYKELENYWNKLFNLSKKLISENPTLNKNKVKELLKPFADIEIKKGLIINLLNNANKYIEADTALKNRDFKSFFNIAENFPFIKDTDNYKKTLTFGEQLIEKIGELELKNDFDGMLKLLQTLVLFKPFTKFSQEKTLFIRQKMNFFTYIQTGAIRQAYQLAEKYHQFRTTIQFQNLEAEFKKVLDEAYKVAYKGQTEEVMKIFGIYLEIPYWLDKVASVMKISYLQDLKENANDGGYINWADTYRNYVVRFGKDYEIDSLADFLLNKDVLNGLKLTGAKDGYKREGFIPSLIVTKKGS